MHVRDESGSDSGRVHVHIVVHVMRARVHVLACAHAHACASACCEPPQGRRGGSIDSWCRDHRATGLVWCTFRGCGDRSVALTFTGEEGTSFASRVVPTCAAALFCDVPASRGGREAKWSLGICSREGGAAQLRTRPMLPNSHTAPGHHRVGRKPCPTLPPPCHSAGKEKTKTKRLGAVRATESVHITHRFSWSERAHIVLSSHGPSVASSATDQSFQPYTIPIRNPRKRGH